LRTFAIVVSRVYLPPGWSKFWWFADRIQYDDQRQLEKKHPSILSGKIHAPADSFLSKNEGMNEAQRINLSLRHGERESARRTPLNSSDPSHSVAEG
jgi:hypothetical protein